MRVTIEPLSRFFHGSVRAKPEGFLSFLVKSGRFAAPLRHLCYQTTGVATPISLSTRDNRGHRCAWDVDKSRAGSEQFLSTPLPFEAHPHDHIEVVVLRQPAEHSTQQIGAGNNGSCISFPTTDHFDR